MADKVYGQYCGLAKALDLVGERWTMLIIRDLAFGPRRADREAARRQPVGLLTGYGTKIGRALIDEELVEQVIPTEPDRRFEGRKWLANRPAFMGSQCAGHYPGRPLIGPLNFSRIAGAQCSTSQAGRKLRSRQGVGVQTKTAFAEVCA